MIGPAILWHLEVNGCTKYKLAAAWGVNRCVITQLCKEDSNPTWLTIIRVAKTLGISVSAIVGKAEQLKKEHDNETNK